ncbi:hypothetical protein D9M71_708890 [compost metagenome]
MDSAGNDEDSLDVYNALLKINGKFASASGAAAELERVATYANLAHTRLGGLETGIEVK